MGYGQVSARLRNPALLLAWGVPLVAVVVGVLSLLMALRDREAPLPVPVQERKEGFQLHRDFARGRRAEELRIIATLAGFDTGGRCELSLRSMSKAPSNLVLLLSHATNPGLDQRVMFHRVTDGSASSDRSASYVGVCSAVAKGYWRMELIDESGDWIMRQSIRGSPGGATLDAVDGRND